MKQTYKLIFIALLLLGLCVSGVQASTELWNGTVNTVGNFTQTLTTAQVVKPIVQGVTSTDNIDQSQPTLGVFDAVGTSGGYKLAQSFIPTKSQTNGVMWHPSGTGGTPSGDLAISIQTSSAGAPSGTKIASTQYTLAQYNALSSPNNTTLPCILNPGTTYWIVFENVSVETGSNSYNIGDYYNGGASSYANGVLARYSSGTWSNLTYDSTFRTLYAKNTEDVSVDVNGVALNLISNGTAVGDATGILSGAIVDTDVGVFSYENGFNTTSTGKFSDIFSSTAGGYATSPLVINGWGWTNTGESVQSASDATARSVTFKLNTMLPVTWINVTSTAFNNNVNTGLVEISGDNVTYSTLIDYPASASAQTVTASSNFVTGNSTFYVRLSKDTSNGYIRWDALNVTALINTTGLPVQSVVGTNYYNISSNGRADSASLDPSMLVNVRLMGITEPNPVLSFFSMFNEVGTAPHTTYLYDTSTNLTGSETFGWVLGDGNTSTSKNLYFTWNATGVYTVNHSVSNGVTTSYSQANVTVGTPTPPVIAPVASFYGSPTTGNVPLTVSFTDVSSNTPTSWFWEFGDGTNSTLQNPSHAYTRSGFRTVNLTATNSAGSNVTTRLKFVKVS